MRARHFWPVIVACVTIVVVSLTVVLPIFIATISLDYDRARMIEKGDVIKFQVDSCLKLPPSDASDCIAHLASP